MLGVWVQESQAGELTGPLKEETKENHVQTLGMSRGLAWEQVWELGTDPENKESNWGGDGTRIIPEERTGQVDGFHFKLH